MVNLPPHLQSEEKKNTFNPSFKKLSRQGRSKYGKGGARGHKAKSRIERANKKG